MFNLKQLSNKTDTLKREYDESVNNFTYMIKNSYLFNDSVFTKMKQDTNVTLPRKEYMKKLDKNELQQVYGIAVNNARTSKGRCSAEASETVIKSRDIARMGIEWHPK